MSYSRFGAAALSISIAALLTACIVTSNAQTPVLEYTSTTLGGTGNGDLSSGWTFTTNQPFDVVALDAFDPTGTGAVRLYDNTSLLASAVVTGADPKEGSPTKFYSHAIAPVLLTAGHTYFIVQDIGKNSTITQAQVGGLTTDPSINYVGAVSGIGLGKDPMGNVLGAFVNPGLFGPNFDIQAAPPAGTPEPSGVALLIGLCAAAILTRLRVRRFQGA